MPISQEEIDRMLAIRDEDIDYSDIPELDEEFFKNARVVMPADRVKHPVSLRVDHDVLQWFKAQGKGHLSRMNAVLRAYMLSSRAN